jgi:hypothetical protein
MVLANPKDVTPLWSMEAKRDKSTFVATSSSQQATLVID